MPKLSGYNKTKKVKISNGIKKHSLILGVCASIAAYKSCEIINRLRQDKIDVLVAVGGHTPDNRLLVLAHKPAPIGIDYGGINTSGMEQIDYHLTDSLIDRPESQKFYVEKHKGAQ